MSALNQQAIEDHILHGREVTYRGLCEYFLADEAGKMQIDRTLQKLRRNGRVTWHRVGRQIVWQATRKVT